MDAGPAEAGQSILAPLRELGTPLADYSAIIIKAATPEALLTVGVDGQMADGKWITLLSAAGLTNLQRVSAGLLLPLTGTYGDAEFRRIRLNWKAAGSKSLVLQQVRSWLVRH